jgi:ribosomal 30S subunit maturation factor RimM
VDKLSSSNLIGKLVSLIEWRNNDIYYVSSSQVLVLPSHITFTEAISLERISHDISPWNAAVYDSNTCDGARRYF